MEIKVDTRKEEKYFKQLQQMCEANPKDEFTVVNEYAPIGDCVCAEKSVCIERKTPSDFYTSLQSQRLHAQVFQMRENYENNFIIVTGRFMEIMNDPHIQDPHINQFLGAVGSFTAKYKVPVLSVDSPAQYGKQAYYLIKQANEPVELNVVKRLQATAEDGKLAALTACKGVSLSRARLILDKFGTIQNVCNATSDEISEIPGLGKKIAQNIKDIFI